MLDGATAAAPGVRFRGVNRSGLSRWTRVAEILVADAPRELRWRTAGPPFVRDSTEWRVRLDPVDGGTRIRQDYRVLSLPAGYDLLFSLIVPGHRDRAAALAADLRRLGEVAARPAAAPLAGPAPEPVPGAAHP